MVTGMMDVTTLYAAYAAKHGELTAARAVSPEDATPDLGPASPEAVVRNIAKRARVRVVATLGPLTLLFVLLLLVISRVGL